MVLPCEGALESCMYACRVFQYSRLMLPGLSGKCPLQGVPYVAFSTMSLALHPQVVLVTLDPHDTAAGMSQPSTDSCIRSLLDR